MKIIDNNASQRKGMNKTELIMLGSVSFLCILGLVTSLVNLRWFEDVYIREDGFIENITLIPLLIAAIVSFSYLIKLSAHRSWLFTACMIFAIVFSIFIAGEEISWGQRIFNIESSGFFKENNAQHETNLHNLVVGGKKVNKIVFSLMLFAGVSIYLLILPVAYRRNQKIRELTDWAGIPVPHNNEIFAAGILFLLTNFIPSGKKAELLEMAITTIFLLILLYPYNLHVFRRNAGMLNVFKKPSFCPSEKNDSRRVA